MAGCLEKDKPRYVEAQQAITDAIEQYRDVLGPQCWCAGEDDCEQRPCPAVPALVESSGWVLCIEWSDLDPCGDESTSFHTRPGTGSNRALGMLTRVRSWL